MLPWTARRAYSGWSRNERGSAELSEDAGTGTDEAADDAVLLFVGGPLDGRVEIRAARHGDPLPTITHVHLHGGPKVVHRYDLQTLTDSAGVYTLRPREQQPARDESVAD
ncbi:hypothetical protein [Candidatus Blastococcus massiliensis]|uniref:hypothetical protein n=1 Tax=Candidatus Blastococcus massiliensis TaxID=1470358 RepID=UPI001E57A6D3|nr:hypothetical protein [Candidatus Blastococcus massiliensis]